MLFHSRYEPIYLYHYFYYISGTKQEIFNLTLLRAAFDHVSVS